MAKIARSESASGLSETVAPKAEATDCGDALAWPYTWIRFTVFALGEDMRVSLRWCR